MIKIRIFSTIGNSTNLMKTYINVTGKSNFKNIRFVDDDSYTHAIIIYGIDSMITPQLNIPKENVIGLCFEPYCIIKNSLNNKTLDYIKQNISIFNIGDIGDLPSPFQEHYCFQWHKWKSMLLTNTIKKKKMSFILSNKKFLPGHQYRYLLLDKIINSSMDIDLYGSGIETYKKFNPEFYLNKYNDLRENGIRTHMQAFNHYQKFGKHEGRFCYDPRYKGYFKDTEPYDDYQFSIAIENSTSKCYISEKFVDPIVRGCIPIYLGAENIENYFGTTGYYKLTGNLDEDIKIIENIYNNYQKYVVKLDNIQNEIFNNNACIFNYLDKIFN